MFFKRSKGEFRETERITRFKLIKSGKTWVRASISQLGLFRVSRTDATDEIVRPFETSADPVPAPISKGILVLGALAGATTIADPVFAEENEMNVALESEISPATGVAGQDSFVLGTTSIADSASASQSMSESISFSESASESDSLSQSVDLSESHVVSVSASPSTSETASHSLSEDNSIHRATSETSEEEAVAQTTHSEGQVKRLQVLALWKAKPRVLAIAWLMRCFVLLPVNGILGQDVHQIQRIVFVRLFS